MCRSLILLLVCALTLSAAPTAPTNASKDAPLREGPRILAPADHRVGELIDDISFTDLAGKPGKLSDYRDKRALVICLTSTTCPIAKKYAPRLAQLGKTYGEKNVAFLFLNTGDGESVDRMKQTAAQQKVQSPYIPDRKGTLTSALAATTTTEVFVLDSARTLVYRGAIDDQYGLAYSLASPHRTYLTDALDALLADQPILVKATSAPGCQLDVKPAVAANHEITWHNHISRIVQNNCQECHRKGENGPFELMTYQDMKAAKLATVKRVIDRRQMPPWFGTEAHGTWANDRSLSDRDRNDMLAWIAAGAPEGDQKDAPLARQWPEGWRIGTPDEIFTVTRSTHVPADGVMPYQLVKVSTNLTEDKWVKAIEIRPTHPEVVHHVLAFLSVPKDHPRAADAPKYPRGGLSGYFAGMVPGQNYAVFPEGAAKFLPRGSTLVFQIHYTPNGTAVDDTPQLAVIFAKGKPENEINTKAAANSKFLIPPGAPNHEVIATQLFDRPTRLLAFMPHSHVRGKAFKFELIDPAGQAKTILNVPRYDFNWQFEYWLAEPIDVASGTILKVTAWYDNSKDNPANPDPTKAVKFGEQTFDEMMIGYYTGYPLGPATTQPTAAQPISKPQARVTDE